MNIYDSYVSEPNSKMDIYDAKMDNSRFKLATINEMVNIRANQIYNDINTKIIMENGTDEDYSIMCEEVSEETLSQKKGIIKKLFEWFEDIFKAIKAKLDKIFKDSNNNTDGVVKYAIDDKLDNDIKDIDDYYKKIQQILSQLKRGKYIDASVGIDKIDEPDIMKSDKSDVSKSTKDISESERDKLIDGLHDKLSTIEKVIVDVRSKINSEDDLEKMNAAITVLQTLQNLTSAISKVITRISGLKVSKNKDNSDKPKSKLPFFGKKKDEDINESYTYIEDDYSMYF